MSKPDDEVLGKAYDSRLVARLWEVTRPHQRLVLLSLVLFPLTAAVELLGPYLVKVAIDQHILVGDWSGLGGMAQNASSRRSSTSAAGSPASTAST